MRALFAVNTPKKVYAYVRQALEDGNSVSYLSTQSSADLASSMSKFWPDVANYVTANQLVIRSAYDYFPSGPRNKLGRKDSPASKIPKEVKNSIVVLCPSAVSTYVKIRLHESRSRPEEIGFKVTSIADFETSVDSRFTSNTLVCCLFDRFVCSLDVVSLLLLMKYHEIAIGSNGKIMPLSEDDIINAIKIGWDSVLGDGSSTLILKTLRYVYNINEDAFLQNPSACFKRLEKTLGAFTADKIRSASSRELRKLITSVSVRDRSAKLEL